MPVQFKNILVLLSQQVVDCSFTLRISWLLFLQHSKECPLVAKLCNISIHNITTFTTLIFIYRFIHLQYTGAGLLEIRKVSIFDLFRSSG